jgi:site-specific DNA-methyltransferase (adenine-specific)
MIRIEHADMLEAIPRLVAEGVVCDACATDPPYHLTATQKRFGAANSAPAQHGRDGAMARLSGGFMGQQWDGGDIAFRPETWATVATILRPGAFLIAFGGTRTYHRLVCAIEDAGFVIQDQIAWMFGTGFPKRRDMLKPAFEPICLAYKPGGKRTMQIDECRIETDGLSPSVQRRACAARSGNYGRIGDERNGDIGKFRANGDRAEGLAKYLAGKDGEASGRWPANVCHDGSDEVLAGFPYTGISAGGRIGNKEGAYSNLGSTGWSGAHQKGDPGFGDSGSAARFFFSAKAGAEDRWGSRHPTVKPVELMKWLVALVTPLDGLVLDPFAGSGTTGAAALGTGRDAILIEREDNYIADIRERIAFHEGEGKHSLAAKARRVADKPLGGLFSG